MKILVLNSGSSSIKYQLFRSEDWVSIANGLVARIAEPKGELKHTWLEADGSQRSSEETHPVANHDEGIDRIVARLRDTGSLADVSELVAIGHRVVHGGTHFKEPVIVDDGVVEAIRGVIALAPLHNPGNLSGIEVTRRLFPKVPSVAIFDTAFHQSMTPTAYRYAIPEYLYTKHQIRRYGFHGTSHLYVAKRAARLLGKPLSQCNLITLHLGNGTSATAIRRGQCMDTSMGMTPLEGLVMGTRSGDIDPGVLIYLNQNLGFDIDQIDHLLNRESGLLGICGVNDMREIDRQAGEGNARAKLAISINVHRLKKYIGAYYAVLGQVHAIVFTGGIGENSAQIRARSCKGLERLGIVLDASANQSGDSRGERCVSVADGEVKVLVIPTNEELEIAQQAMTAVGLQ